MPLAKIALIRINHRADYFLTSSTYDWSSATGHAYARGAISPRDWLAEQDVGGALALSSNDEWSV